MKRQMLVVGLLGLVGCGAETSKAITDGVLYDTSVDVDEDAPIILHDLITNAQRTSTDVSVSANVTDEGSGVDTVAVVYRRSDAATWSTALLSLVDEEAGDWQGAIPGADVSGSVMVYYIHAIDKVGNESFAPNDGEANPQEFRVSPDV